MKISTLEIALKPDLADAKAEALINKAASYFNIHLDTARCVHIRFAGRFLPTLLPRLEVFSPWTWNWV